MYHSIILHARGSNTLNSQKGLTIWIVVFCALRRLSYSNVNTNFMDAVEEVVGSTFVLVVPLLLFLPFHSSNSSAVLLLHFKILF